MAAKTKKAKKEKKEPKHNYIVTWDQDGDPAQTFTNLDDAKEFAGALVAGDQDLVNKHDESGNIDCDYVDKESVRVYKVTSIFKPKITVELIAVTK